MPQKVARDLRSAFRRPDWKGDQLFGIKPASANGTRVTLSRATRFYIDQ
jgi:hypothetical protein